MKHSFLYDTDALIIVAALFVLMFAAIKIGYKISSGRLKPDSDHSGILSSLLGLRAIAQALKKHSSLFTFGFCFLTCVVIYITLDLDRPRRGIINLQNEIVLLRDLQTNFN